MVAAPTMSQAGIYMARSIMSVLHALDNNRNISALERQQLYDAIAGHLRNAAPLSLSLPDPALSLVPVLPLHIPLDDGAFVEVSEQNGRLAVYCHDDTQHDSIVMLTPAQAAVVRQALGGMR